MKVEALWTRIPGVARLLRRWSVGPQPAQPRPLASRPLLTPEQFQEELAVLGLSGTKFGPEEYLEALSEYLGVSVSINVIPDDRRPELSQRLALSGRLGEVRYSEELSVAAIFLPGSLPPLVSDLTIFHELGHLAAGDLLISGGSGADGPAGERSGAGEGVVAEVLPGKRLARALPFATEELREHEANLRASYALVAGCLGEEHPYAHDLYSVL